jgi:hypothetical protein
MYAEGRTVISHIPEAEGEATIEDAYWQRDPNGKRRACYIIRLDKMPDRNYACGPEHLSAVDYYCDGCGKPRRGIPHAKQEVRLGDGTVDDVFGFCFLCAKGEG